MGDGQQTLSSLIKQHPKGTIRVAELFNRHKDNWDIILPEGENYILSYAAKVNL